MNDNKDEDEIVVVTIRCIDSVAHFDDIDKAKCGICGEMTWLSANWRGRKIDNIICKNCFDDGEYIDEDSTTNITESCINDAVKFIKERYGMTEKNKDIRKKMIAIVEEKLGKKINVIK